MPVIHPDKLLTRRMQRGDQSAFDEFFKAYFSRLYRFARCRLDDEDAVKDIVQKTLVRAVAKVHTYRGEAALFTWLCRLCRNEISDHYRRAGRRAGHELPLDDLEVRGVLESLDDGGSEDPVRSAERLQLVLLIQGVVDHLPARQGNALEWKYVQGLSVEEIAARLEVSHAAAQSLLARARQSFRDGFAALGQAETDLFLKR